MFKEQKSSIYTFKLDFDLGYRFAEVIDLSHIRWYDGILVRVFQYAASSANDDASIEKIISSGIKMKFSPINKIPNTKGRGAWRYLDSYKLDISNLLYFKDYRGLLMTEDWTTLSPWYKEKPFDEDDVPIMLNNYEEVRYLETMILQHPETIKEKATMLELIENEKKVADYYNLQDQGNKNLYVQLVNTYFSHVQTKQLLNELKH